MTSKRINITADASIQEALAQAAKRDGMLVTTKATELLRLALEIEEDIALVAVVAKRASTKARFVAHKDAWR